MIKDLIIPVALVLVLGGMMVPVPPAMMDFLLIGNLIFALSLLVSAFFVSDPLKLSSLPTLLLLATLTRLSLNVASVRLILTSGDAGKAIEAFGKVLIQGNVVVGLVVFLVITLIQFIVVAKGAERVAEVAARFTLDALPGKQMSIDADVRAGLIDFNAARLRREELQTESRFYGALDGAMKFIKGDAIAGLVVTFVNIVGGFIIGMAVQELAFSEALSKFTILSVGDGLLSQVPALLNAVAAGVMVTRVGRGKNQSLSSELYSELSHLTKVKLFLAGSVGVLLFVPGMPALPCIVLLVVLLLAAFFGRNQIPSKDGIINESPFEPKLPAPLRVELSAPYVKLLQQEGVLIKQIEQFRKSIFNEIGLVLLVPEIDEQLEYKDGFRIMVRGVVVGSVQESASIAVGEATQRLINELAAVVKRYSTELIDDGMTRRLLDYLERELPEVVSAVIPGIISLTQLTRVLKNVRSEGISIRNIDLIVQAISESGTKESGERLLTEYVRVALRRVISATFTTMQGELHGYTLAPLLDLTFMKAEREGVVVEPHDIAGVASQLQEIEREFGALPNASRVLLTSKVSRRYVSEFLRLRRIYVPVLAYDEIIDEVVFVSHGVIQNASNAQSVERGEDNEKMEVYDEVAA